MVCDGNPPVLESIAEFFVFYVVSLNKRLEANDDDVILILYIYDMIYVTMHRIYYGTVSNLKISCHVLILLAHDCHMSCRDSNTLTSYRHSNSPMTSRWTLGTNSFSLINKIETLNTIQGGKITLSNICRHVANASYYDHRPQSPYQIPCVCVGSRQTAPWHLVFAGRFLHLDIAHSWKGIATIKQFFNIKIFSSHKTLTPKFE